MVSIQGITLVAVTITDSSDSWHM